MKEKLIYFLSEYGLDFFHKLPKYKTAKLANGDYVSLSHYDPKKLTFFCCRDGFGSRFDVFELDDFCL